MNTTCRHAAGVLLAACLGLACSAVTPAGRPQAARGVSQVNDAQTVVLGVVAKLGDAELGTMTEAALDALNDRIATALEPMEPQVEPGQASPTALPAVLAIGLPSRWPAERSAELPLLVATRTTGLRDWQVSNALNLRLRVTSLDDGRTWTRRVGGTPKRVKAPTPSMSGAPPRATVASSHGSSVTRFVNLLAGMRGDAWPAGRYAVTALNFDWVSNTRVLEFAGGAPAAPTGDALRPTVLLSDLDSAPPGLGLQFRVPAELKSGDALNVKVILSLPARQLVLRRPADAAAPALALGSLLLVRLDAEQPAQMPLAIAVRAAVGDAEVARSFAFDAREGLGGQLVPGAYQAYLVFGEAIAGPQPLVVR